MSALELLDADTRAKVEQGDPRIRADLRMITTAEAAQWVVSFRNNSWHNTASFTRGDDTVWYAPSSGWRRAKLINGRYTALVIFGNDEAGLRAALAAP